AARQPSRHGRPATGDRASCADGPPRASATNARDAHRAAPPRRPPLGELVPRGAHRTADYSLVTQPITPDELVAEVYSRIPGALLAFDVDGVLAPLVDHVDESTLSDGVDRALGVLVGHTPVALLSGRSLASLA